MNVKKMWKKNYGYILSWFLTGLIFSFVVSAMVMSGSTSITSFYNVGKVYEIPNSVFRTSDIQNGGHQEVSGKVVLDNGSYGYGIILSGNKDKWNYFCIRLKETDPIDWKVVYENHKGTEILSSKGYECKLYTGMNILRVPKMSFNFIGLTAIGEDGSSFYVKDMQLREKTPVFDGKKAVVYILFSILIYTFFSTVLLFAWRKSGVRIDLYSWIDVLQRLYIIIAEQLKRVKNNTLYSKIQKLPLRLILFVALLLYSAVVEIKGTYFLRFKYHIIIYIILLLAISVVSIEEKLRKIKWNNCLVWSWVILWIMTCVSDFVVSKDFRFIGYVMVFVIGFFIFIWNNMKDRSQMTRDFVYAVHIYFILIMGFCLLCRPEIDGMRYSGFTKNASVFALHLGTFCAVALGELESKLKAKEKFTKLLPYILEVCVVLVLSWKAQSACPILCIMAISLIWFLRMMCFAIRHKHRTILAKVVLSIVILSLPVYAGIDWGFNHIPQSLGTVISYDDETPVARSQYGMVVYAGDLKEKLKNTRLGQKFTDTSVSAMISGRDYYYRAYLREINLLGHKKKPVVWGYERLPHNSVIGISHRYGVFAVVPYVVMLVMTILYTFRYSKRKERYASIPFYVCMSSILMSMADNVELPFIWLPWIGLYLMMGAVFCQMNEF